ncbi:MAG: NAD(+) diphosphatase [Pseudomonadales bacterium]|nr:NAD(+) diphosphatase [Pseudomonadales bacterium]
MNWETDKFIFEPGTVAPEDCSDGHHIIISNSQVVSPKESKVWRPLTDDEMKWLDMEILSKHYLGQYDDKPSFVYEIAEQKEAPGEHGFIGLYGILGQVDPHLFSVAGRAIQVLEWHRNHRFCGRCGAENKQHEVDRAKVCERCGLMAYPRLSPCIIVLVTRGEELLLGHSPQFPTNMYSTLAGFMEPGESVEQTLHREIWEEVGIEVTNVRYAQSQSWPFPNNVMLGFYADYKAGEITPDGIEITDARWFHYKDLPNVPGNSAISGWLINNYIKQLKN